MTSPTSRTLAALRKDGWIAEKVEQRLPIPGRFVTRDMGGFADGVAWRPDYGILAWQATSGSNVSSRLNKIAVNEKARDWILAGGLLQVWGWRKAGDRGARKTWQVRVVALMVEDGRMVEAIPGGLRFDRSGS